jgi:hypothetical protein
VRPGRLSVSRLLNWLRSVFPSNIVGSGHRNFRTIPTEVAKYLHWWQLFLLQYNGVASTKRDISLILSGVTSNVIFSVSTVTPKNSILVEGFTLFSTDSSNPQN